MSGAETVPFLDLVTPHHELEEELVSVFREALRSGRFIGGQMVEGFENEFARFCGAKHCVGVGSGTDALRFALIAAGIEKGDTVITVPNTFIATTEAISQSGAFIDFVDIDEQTYNLDAGKLRDYLEMKCTIDSWTGSLVNRQTSRPVTAIIPVHLYGQPADMDAIMELAEKYGLIVIEDACQAHGAECFSRKAGVWNKAGSIGNAAAFSFYPGKNLGACGEAGAVTTNDAEIARKIRMLRDHGQSQKYCHDIEGYNGRLDAIQAGCLSVKLKHLERWTQQRKVSAGRYNDLLARIDGIISPFAPAWTRAVYHLYVIRSRKRDDLQAFLNKNNIFTGLHYPVPLHLQKAYVCLGYKDGDFPIAEKVARELLSLPMYPELTETQQQRIAEMIEQALCP
jgi:dTDP-4-amino-4,6-dideoxygalactose transaminase